MINSEKEIVSSIEVFNLQGQKVKESELQIFEGNNSFEIDLSSSAAISGMYLLRVRIGTEVFTEKIMIRK